MSQEMKDFMQGNVGVCCRSESDLKKFMSAVDDTVACEVDVSVWDGRKRNIAKYDTACNSVMFVPRSYFITHGLMVVSAAMI